ncbi:hypothetical protein [Evansella clarkii]|uniref:hypothetical protein n=1 Tax=Evansella clarkii TaxID=79879 RepID=UPI000997EFC6|nr:hypothetical protein [Evansella clarkii]
MYVSNQMMKKINFCSVILFCISIIFITLGSTVPAQADDDFGIIFPESKSRLVDTDIEDESGSWGPDGPGGFFPGGIDNVNPPGTPDPDAGDPGSGHPGHSGDPNHPDYDDRSFWERLRDFGRDLWDGAVEAGRDLGELASDTWDYITDPDGLRADAASFGEWLLDGFVDTMSSVGEWFGDAWDGFNNWLSSVGGFFSNAWEAYSNWVNENLTLVHWIITGGLVIIGAIVFIIAAPITTITGLIIGAGLLAVSAISGIIYAAKYAGTENFSIWNAALWVGLPLLGFGGVKLFAGGLLTRGLASAGGIMGKAFVIPAFVDMGFNLFFNLDSMTFGEILFSAATTGLMGMFTLGLGKAVLAMPTIRKKVGTLLFGGVLGGSGNFILSDYMGEAGLSDFLTGAAFTMAFSLIVAKYIPKERQEGAYEYLIEGAQKGITEFYNKVKSWFEKPPEDKKAIQENTHKFQQENNFENKYYGP